MSTAEELAGRNAKILDLVAEVEKVVAAEKFSLGNAAIAAALEGVSEAFWTDLAKKATVARLARGDKRVCRHPSAETRAGVIAHFRNRLTPLERATLAIATAGPGGSFNLDETTPRERTRADDSAVIATHDVTANGDGR